MALTSEFISAVRDRNLLRIRIMLKDSLLVDKTFRQFYEMCSYADSNGVSFWMPKELDFETRPRETWNADLMNLELTRLVNGFTKERINYCQALIEKVYGPVTAYPAGSPAAAPGPVNASSAAMRTAAGNGSSNSRDYDDIIKGASRINSILRDNKTETGRNWTFNDIEAIRKAANQIGKACDNIRARRG